MASPFSIPSQEFYNENDTGAVRRSLASKLADIVSVLDFGADKTGATDSTAAIQAAATAASAGGTVLFPAGTYKINSTVTVAIGVNLRGYGAILDLTSNTGVAFSYNVGGSFSFTQPPTIIQGFRVNGTQANSGTYLAKTNRTPYFTIRDVTAFGSNVAWIVGEGVLSKFDRITSYNGGGNVFLFQLGTGSFGANFSTLDHVYIEHGNVSAVGVKIDYGDITITNSYFEELPWAIWINGGAASLSDSSVNLRGTNQQAAIRIDGALKDPAVIVSGCYISFGEQTSASNQSYGIQNAATGLVSVVVVGNAFSDISTLAAPATIIQTTAAGLGLSGVFTGNRVYANPQSSQQLFTVFDPTTVAGGLLYMEVSGNTFWADAGAPSAQIDITKAGATGSLAQMVFGNNNFLRATNLLRLDGGKVSNNNFQGIAPTITWSGTGGSLTDNVFGTAPTITGAGNANSNVGYTTTIGPVGHARTVTNWAATINIDASVGDIFEVPASTAIAHAIGAPTNPVTGQEIAIKIKVTVGALPGTTWNAIYKMAAWTDPANGFSGTIKFIYDGTNWVESERSVMTVPN